MPHFHGWFSQKCKTFRLHNKMEKGETHIYVDKNGREVEVCFASQDYNPDFYGWDDLEYRGELVAWVRNEKIPPEKISWE